MIPPRIRLDGNRELSLNLLHFAKNQLSILKNQLSFNGLLQGMRRIEDDYGRKIIIKKTGDIEDIYIFTPFVGEVGNEIEFIPTSCWCSCCFSEGRIIKVFGHYGNRGFYGDPDYYPYICNYTETAIQNYNGIRYLVEVCQKTMYKRWVCTPSDFSEYAVGDKVVVVWMGNWSHTVRLRPGCWGCESEFCLGACNANFAEWHSDGITASRVDGVFVVSPVAIEGFNDKTTPGY